jgi:4-aminobutyrate aminotransferase
VSVSEPGRIDRGRPVPDIVTELPGPRTREHVAFDESWTSPSLPRAYPIVPVRGEGLTVEDIDGNLFLDFAAGIAVNSTGHSHPQVVAAIKEQAAELIHFSAADFYLPIYPEVCKRLAEIAPIDGPARAYLGNSGAEAVEAAIKLARYATKRPYIVAFLGAFHGRTYGALSLTASKAKYHAGFGPLLSGVFHAPYGKVDDLRWFDEVLFDKLAPAEEVAAIIVEPIQGEGGYIVPEDGFLQGLREICDRHGIVLIADEIMCGFGRTGEWFAVNHWGIVPDLMSTAKGLTSSYLPLGAVAISPAIARHFEDNVFYGGLTYNSHPLSCAAALAAIQVMEDDDLVGNSHRLDPVMRRHHEELADRHPSIGLHRNIGLFGILELVEDRDTMKPLSPYNVNNETMVAINRALLERGVFTMIRWNGIMTNPPLCITEAQLQEGFEAIDAALEIADRAIGA